MTPISLRTSRDLLTRAPAASPSTIGPSEDRLLTKAQSILRQVQEMNISCHEKIISCREMYNPKETASVLYGTFRDRFCKYMDLTMKLKAVRARYDEAVEMMDTPEGVYMKQSAIVHGERIGGCGELSIETALLAEQAGLAAKVTSLTGETLYFATQSFRNDHALVLVAEYKDSISHQAILNAGIRSEGNFIETMKLLGDVVIIDPYLNKAIRANMIAADPEFITLLTALKVDQLSKGLEMASSLEATISTRTKLIAQVKTMGPLVEVRKGVSDEFVRLKRRDMTIGKLAGIFPETKELWKKNDKSIFLVGSKADIVEISEKLKAIGISNKYAQVKGKEDFCLIIDIQSYFAMQRVYEALTALE